MTKNFEFIEVDKKYKDAKGNAVVITSLQMMMFGNDPRCQLITYEAHRGEHGYAGHYTETGKGIASISSYRGHVKPEDLVERLSDHYPIL